MVIDKVRELLASQLEMDVEKIEKDTDIVNDLGADSLDIVEMIMMLEEEFGIVITDESIYGYKTVGEIAAFIEAELEKNNA
jgi:acyl carrier protein